MIMAMKCMRLHGHGSTVCDGVRRGLAHRRVLVYKGLAVGTCRRKLQPRSVYVRAHRDPPYIFGHDRACVAHADGVLGRRVKV